MPLEKKKQLGRQLHTTNFFWIKMKIPKSEVDVNMLCDNEYHE